MVLHTCLSDRKLSWERLKPFILGRLRQTDEFVCGQCSRTFTTICSLHLHCIKHNENGSYLFDQVTNTAYPKYNSRCSFSQFEDIDIDAESSGKYRVITGHARDINTAAITSNDSNMEETTDICFPNDTDTREETDGEFVSVNVTLLSRSEDGSIMFEMAGKYSHLFDATAKIVMEQFKTSNVHWTEPQVVTVNVPRSELDAIVSEAVNGKCGADLRGIEGQEEVNCTEQTVAGMQVNETNKNTSQVSEGVENAKVTDNSLAVDSNERNSSSEIQLLFHEMDDGDSSQVASACYVSTCNTSESVKPLNVDKFESEEKSVSVDADIADSQGVRKEETVTGANLIANDAETNGIGGKVNVDQKYSRPVRNRKLTSRFKDSELMAEIDLFNFQNKSNKMNYTGKRGHREEAVKKRKVELGNVIDTPKKVESASEEICRRTNKDQSLHKKGNKSVQNDAHKTASEALLSLRGKNESEPNKGSVDTGQVEVDGNLLDTRVTNEKSINTDLENFRTIIDSESGAVSIGKEDKISHSETEFDDKINENLMDEIDENMEEVFDNTSEEDTDNAYLKGKPERPRSVRKNARKRQKSQPLVKRKDLKCETCGKVGSIGMIRYHKLVHSGHLRYSCDVCGKRFTNKPSLRSHMIQHGEKNWKCEHCPQAFYKKAYLITHMRKHTGENPFIFVCDLCGEGFKEKYILKRHINNVHKQIRNYECDICKEKFFRADTRDNHRVRHFEAFLKCSYCTKMFKGELDRRKHELTHTGEKQFFCPLCSQGFSQLFSYYKHMCRQHGIKKEKAKEMRVKNPDLVFMRNKNNKILDTSGSSEVKSLNCLGRRSVVTKELRKTVKMNQTSSFGLEMAVFTEVDESEMQSAVDGASSLVEYSDEASNLTGTVVLNMSNDDVGDAESTVIIHDLNNANRYIMLEDVQSGDSNIVTSPEYSETNNG